MSRPLDKRTVTHHWGNNPTNDEYTNTNGYVISGGHYSHSFKFFAELTAEAKKDFPHLTDEDVECFIITKSRYNQGFAGVRFSLPENTTHPDYWNGARIDFDYA